MLQWSGLDLGASPCAQSPQCELVVPSIADVVGLIALQEAPFYGAPVLSEAIEYVVKVGAIYKRREGLMNVIAREGASISQPETHIVGGFHLSLLPA